MSEKIPKALYVTYVGPESYVLHAGRSHAAKINPYRFIPNHPIRIIEKDDVEFFWKSRKKMNHFLVGSKKPKVKVLEEETQEGAGDQEGEETQKGEVV